MGSTINYRLILLVISAFMVLKSGYGQTYVWAKSLEGFGTSSVENLDPGMSLCKDIAVDSQGNVFICGNSNDSVDFDTGEQTHIIVNPNQNGFVAKYDSAGNFLWAFALQSGLGSTAEKLVMDADDNLIVTGHASGEIDFDPGEGTAILGDSNPNKYFGFFAKYASDGSLLWVKALTDDHGAIPTEIAVDPSGNVFLTGRFYESLDIDPGTAEEILHGTGTCLFFAKYDPDGNLIWGHALSGTGNLSDATDISLTKSGELLFAGYFDNTVDFNPGGTSFDLTAESVSDRFFAKYSTEGILKWAQRINLNSYGCCSPMEHISIRENNKGDVIIAGNFKQTVDFDPGPEHDYLIAGLSTSSFFATYDSLGNYKWAKEIYGPFVPTYDLEIDCRDNIYLTGSLGSADFDPSPAVVQLTSNVPSASTHFLAKYNPEGEFLSVKQIGSSSSGPLICTMEISNNYQYMAGGFRYTADFDPDTSQALLTMSGIGWNGYFAKYRITNEPTTSDTTLCEGMDLVLDVSKPNATYLWQDGQITAQYPVPDSGHFSVSINQVNCTTNLEFNVDIDRLPSSHWSGDTTLCEGEIFQTEIPMGNYSIFWPDGSTDSVYTISDSGLYWVEISDVHCTNRDTLNVAFIDCEVDLQMPNVFTPNSDLKNDEFKALKAKGVKNFSIQIFNRWGQKIFESNNISLCWNGYFEGHEATEGVYFYSISYTTIFGEEQRKVGQVTLLR